MATVMSANKAELLAIADSVAKEKLIDREIVIEAMEDAIQRAAKTRYGAENDIRAKIDPRTGDLRLCGVTETLLHLLAVAHQPRHRVFHGRPDRGAGCLGARDETLLQRRVDALRQSEIAGAHLVVEARLAFGQLAIELLAARLDAFDQAAERFHQPRQRLALRLQRDQVVVRTQQILIGNNAKPTLSVSSAWLAAATQMTCTSACNSATPGLRMAPDSASTVRQASHGHGLQGDRMRHRARSARHIGRRNRKCNGFARHHPQRRHQHPLA